MLTCLRFAALLITVFALQGGAFASRQGATPARTLVFWTMQLAPFHSVFVESMLRDFERGHPGVTVKWVDVPWSEMERKMLASMAAGTAPDVVNLNPQFSAKLAEFSALADPREHLSQAVIDSYLPSAWNGNRLAGRPFGLPWYLTSNLTLVNRSLFQAAGIDPPQRLADLVPSARQLKARTGQYAYFPALDGSAPLEMAVSVAGALPTRQNCEPDFLRDVAPLFDTYRTLYAEGLVPKSILTEGHRSAVAAFLSQQVAMVSTGMQFLGQVKNGNPALYGRIDVYPQLGGDRAPPNIAAMNVAVPNTAKDRALAFALAAFVTNPRNQLALAQRVPILPSTTASYDDPFFQRPTGDPLLDKARTLSIAQVKSGAVLVPPIAGYNRLRTSFLRQLQSTIAGRVQTRQALATVDREWRHILQCP
jgi:putative chitobiose transport system substrate-binding protein